MALRMTRATFRHVLDLAPRLRPEDHQEVYSSSQRTGLQALVTGVTGGPSWAVVNERDQVVFIFGVGPHRLNGVGSPWMLASDLIRESPVTIARNTREAIGLLHLFYPRLVNHVDARNAVHISWIKWAGFTFTGSSLQSWDGTTFLEFQKHV